MSKCCTTLSHVEAGEFDKVVCAGASFVAKVLSEYTLTAAHIADAEAVFSHAMTVGL